MRLRSTFRRPSLLVTVLALLTLVATGCRPPAGGSASGGVTTDLAAVTVSDVAGTDYVASGQGTGGSLPGTSRHEIRFAPAPPEGAHTLTIRIEAFVDPFPGSTAELRGPWEFRVAL